MIAILYGRGRIKLKASNAGSTVGSPSIVLKHVRELEDDENE